MKTDYPNILITDRDYERLASVIEKMNSKSIEMLAHEINRAEVIPQNQISSDVVTMNSIVRIADTENGTEKELKIVYPDQSEISEGKVSVLAPVGMALLGLRTGQEIEWPMPSGKTKKMKVISVSFQPEAAGIYAL